MTLTSKEKLIEEGALHSGMLSLWDGGDLYEVCIKDKYNVTRTILIESLAIDVVEQFQKLVEDVESRFPQCQIKYIQRSSIDRIFYEHGRINRKPYRYEE